jgi:hypothetical protein
LGYCVFGITSAGSKLLVKNESIFIYLGEIANMPEHGIFIGVNTEHVYTRIHISEFVELAEEEV